MPARKQSGLHHPAAVYAKQVTQGKLRAMCCPAEIQACERFLRDLKRQDTPDFPYIFDTTRADSPAPTTSVPAAISKAQKSPDNACTTCALTPCIRPIIQSLPALK